MLKFWNSHKKSSHKRNGQKNGAAATLSANIDRRFLQRRVGDERREMIRFEPVKGERRAEDRRADCNLYRTVTTEELCTLY